MKDTNNNKESRDSQREYYLKELKREKENIERSQRHNLEEWDRATQGKKVFIKR